MKTLGKNYTCSLYENFENNKLLESGLLPYTIENTTTSQTIIGIN